MSRQGRHIPTEILDIFISAIVKDASLLGHAELVSVLQVCKRWLGVGVRIIWTDISLRSAEQLAKFLAISVTNNHSLIHSITLNIEPIIASPLPRDGLYDRKYHELRDGINKHGSRETWTFWTALRKLKAIIIRLGSLKSFSLRIQGSTALHEPVGFWIEHKDVADLLQALPDSDQYLEIDTHCYDRRDDQSSESHVCSRLARKLPQLRHLRLRLSRLCGDIFSSPDGLYPPYIDVNLVGPHSWTNVDLCGLRQDPLELGRMDMDQARCTVVREQLLSGFEAFVHKGSAHRVQIIDGEVFVGRGAVSRRRDLIQGITTTCPYEAFYQGRNFYRQIYDIRLPSAQYAHDFTSIADKDDSNTSLQEESLSYLITIKDIDEPVEGPTWVETIGGSRFPLEYIASQHTKDYTLMTSPKCVPFDDQEARNAAQPHDCGDLWEQEKKAGRMLLRARISKGAGDTEPLYKEEVKSATEGKQYYDYDISDESDPEM